MNVIFLSPYFPRNYFHFCVALKRKGVNVLGIGDTPYENLRQELRDSLSEYYRLDNMESYDELYKAVAFLAFKHGKIDRLDSLNEHWLETEAQLRTDFNIWGVKMDTIDMIKKKSEMKKRFRAAGVKVAEGARVGSLDEARAFTRQHGFPVVAKPDTGVGAAGTYKLESEDDIEMIREVLQKYPMFLEQFVSGRIFSFDGLANYDGEVVFFAIHKYQTGIMEIKHGRTDTSYYSLKELPEDLVKAGMDSVKAFNVRARFFHFEFFRTYDTHEIVGLEVNMRPPGGYTTDMLNYATDISVYDEWANIVVNNRFDSKIERKYHAAYISRKNHLSYLHTHQEVLDQQKGKVMFETVMDEVLSDVLGDHAYLCRTNTEQEMEALIQFIHAKK